MLSGTQRPVAGSIRLDGRNLVGLPSHAFARAGIARKFQVPSLFGNLSVRDNLDVASRSHRSDLARAARVSEIMDSLGLGADAELRAEELSHGRKQWLEIGMTMMTQPRLLLLDEPTAGMTAEETQSTVHLVRRLSGEMGIIVIEHDMTFVRSLAAPTLVMHQGRIIAAGNFATIEQNPLVRNVYLGRQ